MFTIENNGDDYLDTRDIIARIEELESDRDSFVLGAPDGTETPDPEGWARENEDDADELDKLSAFMEEMKGYRGDEEWRGDWYPVTLIHSSYFVEAMEELVKDIGDMPKDTPSYIAIDWEKTAENLRVDYSSVELDGEEYWYR